MLVIIDARMLNASGIGTYIRNILREIAKQNIFDIKCIINAEQINSVLELGVQDYIIFKSKFFSPYEQIEYLTKLPNADILWTPHFNAPLFSLKNKIAKRVVTIHDMFPYEFRENFSFFSFFYINLLMKRATQLSALVFTVSDFSKTEIIKHLKISSEKICTVPLGVDPGFTLRDNDNKIDKKYILCVGNVKPHKNIKKAIEAFNSISDQIPQYQLVIVGKSDGFYSPEKGLDRILKNNKRITFTGFVSFEELRKYYLEASMLLFPSLYEGFGLPVLEAMAFNLPIAASHRASIPEVGGDAIVYFDPESKNEISEAILSVLSSDTACKVSSYQERLKKFTWEECAKQTIDHLNKLA